MAFLLFAEFFEASGMWLPSEKSVSYPIEEGLAGVEKKWKGGKTERTAMDGPLDVSRHSFIGPLPWPWTSFPLDHWVCSLKLWNGQGCVPRKNRIRLVFGGCPVSICWNNKCIKQTFVVRITFDNPPSHPTSPLFLGFCPDLISLLWIHKPSTFSFACECP